EVEDSLVGGGGVRGRVPGLVGVDGAEDEDGVGLRLGAQAGGGGEGGGGAEAAGRVVRPDDERTRRDDEPLARDERPGAAPPRGRVLCGLAQLRQSGPLLAPAARDERPEGGGGGTLRAVRAALLERLLGRRVVGGCGGGRRAHP